MLLPAGIIQRSVTLVAHCDCFSRPEVHYLYRLLAREAFMRNVSIGP